MKGIADLRFAIADWLRGCVPIAPPPAPAREPDQAGPAIEFFTTEELIEQLRERLPLMCLGYVAHEDGPGDHHIRVSGNLLAGMGLIIQMRRLVQHELDEAGE